MSAADTLVPNNAVAKGPGILFRNTIGGLLPGGQATISNKALTSNVATVTAAGHTVSVGDVVSVALTVPDAVFDGDHIVTAITSSTISWAKTNANVASATAVGTVIGGTGPAGVVVGGVFVDAWPSSWVPYGVTRDGSQFSYEITTEDVIVAEYQDPIETDETGRAIGVAFDLAQVTDLAYLSAFGGGTSTLVSGTGATRLTKVAPPKLGESVDTMIGWQSQDKTQRTFFYECKQAGNVQWSNNKAPNYQSFPLTYKVTQPDTGDPFNIYLAGDDRVVLA
jgi:hypothetical protein